MSIAGASWNACVLIADFGTWPEKTINGVESKVASIDIQNLNSGVYWLRICKNGTVEQQKFIKLWGLLLI